MTQEDQDLLSSFGYKLGVLRFLARLSMEAEGSVVPSAQPVTLDVAHLIEDLAFEFERTERRLAQQ